MRTGARSRYRRLLEWQRERLSDPPGDVAGLVHRYCRFLHAEGLSVFRANLSLTTLHPQIKGLRYVWQADHVEPGPFPSPALVHRSCQHLDGCTVEEAFLHYGARETPQFVRSPFYALRESGGDRLSLRIAPAAGNRTRRFPVLDDLAAQGATHYAAFQLRRTDGMISLVTRHSGGFDRVALAHIADTLVVLESLLDSAIKDVVLDSVLRCYVGAGPATEIRRGNLSPGSMLTMDGAIWFSDIRRYSNLSRQLPPDQLVSLLNRYYAVLVEAIHVHGGDILKFIGDAILAIFPVAAGEPGGDACRRALAAVETASSGLAEADLGLQHGVGLHLGRFQFGNIGNHRRVDFTVIGDAVNVAARIEAQCGVQQQALLMSEGFARASGVPTRVVAAVPLKGLDGTHDLHTTGGVA
ncbi:adenylate/guanylate cyclase domain-containing protein [Arenimonas aestuarii]